MAIEWMAQLLRNREITGSNLCPQTQYPERFFAVSTNRHEHDLGFSKGLFRLKGVKLQILYSKLFSTFSVWASLVFFSLWVCSLGVIQEIYCGQFFLLDVMATLFDNHQLLNLCQQFVVPLLHLHCVCDQSIGIMTWPSGGAVPQLPNYPFVVP